jgi:PIN domain nuclease of toxin-antitoxin system
MKYLLDTHVVLWWLEDPKKINIKARKIISDKKNEIVISSVSFWEMAIKKGLNRLKLPSNILEILSAENFKFLSIQPEEALSVSDLPLIHADPFDRMLIIQAKLNDMVLITRDEKIAEYPVVTILA